MTTASAPADPWLATNWLRELTESAQSVLEQLPAARADPVLGRIVSAEYVSDLQRLWDVREVAFAALSELPQPLCHNDLFTRNVRVDEAEGRSVALDWAFCGRAALGQELSALVGASAAFADCRPEDWDRIESSALSAYADGLETAGLVGREADVRTGYLTSLTLRYGIALLPSLAGITLYPEYHDQVAAVWGCPYEDFVLNTAAFCDFIQERIGRTLALLGA